MQTGAIHYQITPTDPYAHLYTVTLAIAHPNAQGQQLSLPSWIPGSYMIRDFAKNIVEIKASCNGQPLKIEKLDKQNWQIEPCQEAVLIEYVVYAWDMSVRSAHLDQNHAYFNGTSVFLEVIGQGDQPCTVSIENAPIAEAENWRVGTSLTSAGAEPYGFGLYQADNYDDLIDHPVEIADFDLISFTACGVAHDFILTGLHNADLERLAQDLEKICEYQIKMFGEPAPFDRYVFITWAVGNGYGGLEHRASTSLICNRDDLPSKMERDKVSEGYKTFLGLCSHEYFHSWNVKRIQPNIAYDLSQENHTPLLWAFEGITSYYDNLVLQRTGLITTEEYLELLGQDFTRLLRNPGRFKQTVSESSFDAWTKFYKQDENASNAIVSYYTKGGIIALLLDLNLRRLSKNVLCLDHVMVELWQRHGKVGNPVQEEDIQELCYELLQQKSINSESINSLKDFFHQALHGKDDLEFNSYFAHVGVQLNKRQAISNSDKGGTEKPTPNNNVDLGIATSADSAGAKVLRVFNNSCAHQAGLSAGDIIIALNHIKVDNSNLENLLKRYSAGEEITLHAFRRDELMQFKVVVESRPEDTAYLTIVDESKLSNWL